MNVQHLKKAFDGLSPNYKQVLISDNKKLLSECLKKVNSAIGNDISKLTPKPEDIFAAFKLCPWEKLRVVIIGQDPYPKPGDAVGLSFSCPRDRSVPQSLKSIYGALNRSGLLEKNPTHGCLTSWASQGVLLLNASLTTEIGKSNAHTFWQQYTDKVIRDLCVYKEQLIFLLWGKSAQAKRSLIDTKKHHVLMWGHPSPMFTANSDPTNPVAFVNCDHFTKVNEMLDSPINWDPDADIDNDINTTDDTANAGKIYLATDGASKDNGKTKCKASWGFHISHDGGVHSRCGLVDHIDVPGEKYTASNNMGELTAIQKGLEYISEMDIPGDIVVISDSEYSIKTIEVWSDKWYKNPVKHKLDEKKNLHLIQPIKQLLEDLRKTRSVNFVHVNSHRPEPNDKTSYEWKLWNYNDIADKLCTRVLDKKVNA